MLFKFGSIFAFVAALYGVSSASEFPSWSNSNIRGTPDPPKPYVVERVYPKLEFKQPVEIMPLADTGRMLLLEVGGKVHTFLDRDDCEQSDVALDLSPIVQNFMRSFGIGIHPNFKQNREIFIVYALNPIARPDGTRLSRFRMTESDPPLIDPSSEEILLTWASGGHNGSAVRFDKQGYLYFSAGDGARPFPPDEYNVSQDLSDLRATICRIDVDHRSAGLGYSIPPDNPFIGVPKARPEIWAFGFRNPWRFSIDPMTQTLMCGDVGWELWELVHRVERGGNYGWSIFEGPQTIRSDIEPGPSPIRHPLFAYPHTDGLSVTGGLIYRGQAIKELDGTYVYGDYVNGKVWGLRFEGDKVTWQSEIANTSLPIITFSQDRKGEILVMSFGGSIHRLIRNPAPDRSTDFPRKLSQTGLFTDVKNLEPSPGVLPYRLNAMAFEDDATSSYVVGLPDRGAITMTQQKRQWVYPKNSVFAKTVSIPVPNQSPSAPLSNANGTTFRRLETQVLHFDGVSWNPYSYLWNEQQTDAELIGPEGTSIEIKSANSLSTNKTWRVHNRSECISCHNSPSGTIAGWDFANLSGPSLTSPERSQLDELQQMGLVTGTIKSAWLAQSMVNPSDENAKLESRARSYLSINCSHCHCRGGGGTVALELTFANTLEAINAIDQLPTQGTFGIKDARVITAGNPYRSVLYYRLATCGAGHMPKIWSRENDAHGIQLVHDWIRELPTNDHRSTENSETVDRVAAENLSLSNLSLSTDKALECFNQVLSGQSSFDDENLKTFKGTNDPIVRGLAERFIPVSERVQRLGTKIDRQQILALQGSAMSGANRYRESSAMLCRNCHRIAGVGQSVGPDLDGIAKKRKREELLESLLEPSRSIEPAFQSHTILTDQGATITGLLVERSDQATTLRSADGKLHTIASEDIEEARALGISLMPTDLAADMTAEELADLLAFLESLK
ncbi:MAG: PQQ-dependent sugar dehydrogenase [Pirellulaceae bacterium]|nr:PQQ-dependent sugar dehydrogenase [Pirellulaceae bacterium]